MSYSRHFSPKYYVLTASILTPEDVKNTYKQREYGINPVFVTDHHTALQGENPNCEVELPSLIVKGETICLAQIFSLCSL